MGRLLGAGAVLCAFTLGSGCTDRGKDPTGPGDPVPEPKGLFASAATCGTCHPQHYAEWQTSIHAFAGSDPVMHALSEIATGQAGETIGQSCFECHAPALMRQQRYLASLPAGVDPPELDDLTHDGISCDLCHSISVVPPVGSIDFLRDVDPSGPKLAGIMNPIDNPFHESAGDNSFTTSIQCAACHQVGLENGTGVENTYDEWLDSVYGGMPSHCQDCHMPEYSGPAAKDGPVRWVHRHHFVGPDYAYEAFRGIDLEDQKNRIRDLMRNSVSVTMSGIPSTASPGEDVDFTIEVRNDQTGHSIPSGVSFSRDMWIQVEVKDDADAIVYRSGWLEANGDLVAPAVDPDLEFFGSTMYDGNGDPTRFTWAAETIDESKLLKVFARRTASYRVSVPAAATGTLTFELALRFRPVAPEIIRAANLERLLPIEIFDMWTDTRTVTITP